MNMLVSSNSSVTLWGIHNSFSSSRPSVFISSTPPSVTFKCLQVPVQGGWGVRKPEKPRVVWVSEGWVGADRLWRGSPAGAVRSSDDGAGWAIRSGGPRSRCWPVVVGCSVCGAHPGGGAGRGMCFALLSSSTTQARLDWSWQRRIFN